MVGKPHGTLAWGALAQYGPAPRALICEITAEANGKNRAPQGSIPRSQGRGLFSGAFVAFSPLTSGPIAVSLAVGISFLPDPNRTQNYCFIVMFCI